MHPCLLVEPVCVHVPQCNMPRPKGLSSRPRKKARLEPAETERPESTDIFQDLDGQLDVVAPEKEPEDEVPPPGSPGAVKRVAAADMYNEAIEHAAVMRAVEKTYRDKEAVAKRVCDARDRRIDDAKKTNRKRSLLTMWNRVCKRLENIIEQQEAQLKAAWVSTKAAKAMVGAHESHVCVLQLEIARLRRELRRTKK